MASPRSGVINTANQATEGRAKRDVSPVINQLEPNKYPLTVFLTKLSGGKMVTDNYKFEWLEDTLLPKYDLLAAAVAADDSSITVTNYAYFVKNMLIQLNKSEIVRVTATPATTTVSITRAVDETSATTASLGDQIRIVSMAYEEGGSFGDILSTTKSNPYNYTQNFRKEIGRTWRAKNSGVYGKKDAAYDRAKMIVEHAKDIEYAIILGERYYNAAGDIDSNQLSTTRGIKKFISTNSYSLSGTMTEAEFDEIGRKSYRYGSNKKLGIFSSKVTSVVNGFAKEKIQTESKTKSYGIDLSNYRFGGGNSVDIVSHPLLENDSIADLSGLAGTGFIVDVKDIKLRHLANSFMVHESNPIQDGAHTDKEEVWSDCGLQLEQEKKHAEFDGVQG
jgi:hypothetical protein